MKSGLMGLVLHVYKEGSCPTRMIRGVPKNPATGESTDFFLSIPENKL